MGREFGCTFPVAGPYRSNLMLGCDQSGCRSAVSAALCALEPRLHGQELRCLAGAGRGKIIERDRALMAAERG